MTPDEKCLGNISLSIVTALVVAVVILMTCISCTMFNKKIGLVDDNPAEQVAELVIDAVIEKELGVDPKIDLTPGH